MLPSLRIDVEQDADGTYMAIAPWLVEPVYGLTFEDVYWAAIALRPR